MTIDFDRCCPLPDDISRRRRKKRKKKRKNLEIRCRSPLTIPICRRPPSPDAADDVASSSEVTRPRRQAMR
ncbi:hypothetical protein MUK42_34418 [Musa troglodytarum]|uniref:Uncharacterized protein n=1 Tax=Musa troglodytarum TaxID=320322 RepID=A0A9E7H4F9_9LILI|nr:hypothetical protein MUK42_34418 [Musa troglodytarum]